MANPLVSVIIPVYNVEPYLSECLNSVLNQTYKDIEIITINDGSTDRSLDILKKYQLNYSNIKVFSQNNSGLSASRNKGIDLAKGKYIYFLDSDDYILPDTLKNLIGLMEEYSLDLIRFAAEPFDGTNSLNSNQYDFQEYFEKGKVYRKEDFLTANLQAFSSSACLYIMRRDFILNKNIKFKPGIIHEDELFTLKVFLNTNSAMYDPNLYYKRRYRNDSIMTSNSSQKIKESFDSYCVVVKEMNELLEKYKKPSEVKLVESRIRTLYINLIYKNIDEHYKRDALSKIKGIKKREKIYYTLRYKLKKYLKI